MKNLKELSLEDLKYEWVLIFNDYDSYFDKRQWRRNLNEIEYRIKQKQ